MDNQNYLAIIWFFFSGMYGCIIYFIVFQLLIVARSCSIEQEIYFVRVIKFSLLVVFQANFLSNIDILISWKIINWFANYMLYLALSLLLVQTDLYIFLFYFVVLFIFYCTKKAHLQIMVHCQIGCRKWVIRLGTEEFNGVNIRFLRKYGFDWRLWKFGREVGEDFSVEDI